MAKAPPSDRRLNGPRRESRCLRRCIPGVAPAKIVAMDPDLIVIGGGATGIGAVRAARSRGASVLSIEKRRTGGDCTFTGCVPSRP
jgi:NADPH-dependent 2,4-dienoyl-CoA reductase/sulfur reductase-like enzyme